MPATFDTQPQTDAGTASFLVGCDAHGHWIAVETHGLGGGIFRDREAALHYAAFETDRRPGAVRLSGDLLSLVMAPGAAGGGAAPEHP